MDLLEVVNLFVAAKQGELVKNTTIESYQRHLTKFIASLPPERAKLNSVLASDISSFLASERRRGMSPVTILDRYVAINVFFNWTESVEELGYPASPMHRGNRKTVKRPRVPKKEPRRAKLEDIRQLIDSIPRGTWLDLRNRALIQLMLDTGLRVNEVTNLLVADVDLNNHILLVRSGKGDKDRRVPFSEKSSKELAAYLLYRPSCPAKVAPYLFVSSINGSTAVRGRLTGSGVTQLLKRLCKAVNLPKINPHSIRHLFGLKALNDGMRVEVLSKIMGHASVDFTLRVYAPLLTGTISKEYAEKWE